MGLVADIKAIANVQKIKRGKTAKLSISQITGITVNLADANKNLSTSQFQEVLALFNELRKDTVKRRMDYKAYLKTTLGIIMRFDLVAPYEKYCGGNEREITVLMNEMRKSLKETEEKELGLAEKQYAAELVDKSNGIIAIEDSLQFVKILLMYPEYDKERIIDAFDDFTGDVIEKYGETQAIAKVSFFLGVLNVNDIISEDEMNDMNQSFVNAILNHLS